MLRSPHRGSLEGLAPGKTGEPQGSEQPAPPHLISLKGGGSPVRDILGELHFDSSDGSIWLAGRRMLLLHSDVFGALRQEMVASLGMDVARGLITRMGYLAGSKDAAMARELRPDDQPTQAFMVGPQVFALEGFGPIETVRFEMDQASGHHWGEFIWTNSPEADIHIDAYGTGILPACWMEIGYASGYASAFMGKRILVREVECRAMGHAQCRSIARPAEHWDDPEQDLRYLLAHPISTNSSRGSASDRAKAASRARPTLGVPASSTAAVGASVAFITTMHKINRVAPTDATVLLLGESGVGKSLLAREVHGASRRAHEPFVEVNCAAIPEQLLEAELFGVEQGAFTGATKTRPGRFQVADKGTLFLDEIGLLSLTAQGKLLRVLQTGEIERLGSTTTHKVDVRMVAATNENLQIAIKEGRFREDLFYRINVFPIMVPPLRERRDDIPVLLEHCLAKFCARHDRKIVGITPAALQAIYDYAWPGNIREFENVIERGLILADEGSPIDVAHLFTINDGIGPDLAGPERSSFHKMASAPAEAGEPPAPRDLDALLADLLDRKIALSDVEDRLLKAAVERSNGNISRAAGLLGLTRPQLDYRVRKRLASKS